MQRFISISFFTLYFFGKNNFSAIIEILTELGICNKNECFIPRNIIYVCFIFLVYMILYKFLRAPITRESNKWWVSKLPVRANYCPQEISFIAAAKGTIRKVFRRNNIVIDRKCEIYVTSCDIIYKLDIPDINVS